MIHKQIKESYVIVILEDNERTQYLDLSKLFEQLARLASVRQLQSRVTHAAMREEDQKEERR